MYFVVSQMAFFENAGMTEAGRNKHAKLAVFEGGDFCLSI
jgi:hypothetical protein